MKPDLRKLNTHFYDGKLPKQHPLLDVVRKMREENQEELKKKKESRFEKFRQVIMGCTNSKSKQSALNALDLITRNINQGSNCDGSDNMYACDLLYLLIEKGADNKDLLPTIIEQLADIVDSGRCPQGRVKRIWQVLIIFSPDTPSEQ